MYSNSCKLTVEIFTDRVGLVSKEVDLLELFKVGNQSKTVCFVPAFGKHVKTDLTTCKKDTETHSGDSSPYKFDKIPFHITKCYSQYSYYITHG